VPFNCKIYFGFYVITYVIPELKSSPYPDRLKALCLWTLEERRISADLIEVFKMLNGLSGIPFESMFTLDTSKWTRGHSYKILKSRLNTDLRQHFFSERVINFWNSLNDSTEYCISNFSQYLQAATQAAKTSTTDGSTIGHLLSADPGG